MQIPMKVTTFGCFDLEASSAQHSVSVSSSRLARSSCSRVMFFARLGTFSTMGMEIRNKQEYEVQSTIAKEFNVPTSRCPPFALMNIAWEIFPKNPCAIFTRELVILHDGHIETL